MFFLLLREGKEREREVGFVCVLFRMFSYLYHKKLYIKICIIIFLMYRKIVDKEESKKRGGLSD